MLALKEKEKWLTQPEVSEGQKVNLNCIPHGSGHCVSALTKAPGMQMQMKIEVKKQVAKIMNEWIF